MSARDIYPKELLSLSRGLAYEGAGPGRPRTANLRRAVSTAYYAVFHRVCRDAALQFLGNASSPEAHVVVRWIGHADIVDLANLTGTGGSNIRAVITAPSTDLLTLCSALADLKNARGRGLQPRIRGHQGDGNRPGGTCHSGARPRRSDARARGSVLRTVSQTCARCGQDREESMTAAFIDHGPRGSSA